MKNNKTKKWIGAAIGIALSLGIYYFFFAGTSASEVQVLTVIRNKYSMGTLE